jgi:hypothetical protein
MITLDLPLIAQMRTSVNSAAAILKVALPAPPFALTTSSPILLRCRCVSVQKARDADAVGIRVGTFGRERYLNLISFE